MSKLNGTLLVTLVDGTTIGATKTSTLNYTRTNINTSSKDSSGTTTRIYGISDWNISFDGLYDPALTWNVEEMYTVLNSKTKVVVEFAVIDGTGGGLVYRGTALGNNLSIVAPMEEAATISGSFEADGDLTQGTVASS